MIELADGRAVRVAAVLDDRDVAGVAAEVELTALTPQDWRRQLADARPDIVVVQSCELRPTPLPVVPLNGAATAVAAWARRTDVPSVWWSTVATDRALDDVWVAQHFDHVATADLDAVGAWRAALGHDRVHLATLGVAPPLPRADQRAAHATLATAFDPSRTPAGLLDLLQAATDALPVVLHDLPPGDGTGVPAAFAALVAPPPTEVATVDAASPLGLHLPGATQSPTLVDRRLLQQLVAGLPIVGTHAHASRAFTGPHVTSTDDPELLRRAVHAALAHDGPTGLAQDVLASHGWDQALRRLLAPVLEVSPATAPPPRTAAPATPSPRAAAPATPSPRAAGPAGPTTAPLIAVAPWLAGIEDERVGVADQHGDAVVTAEVDGVTDVWSQGTVAPAPLLAAGWSTVWFEVEPRGMVDLLLQFLDERGTVAHEATAHGNVRTTVSVPRGTRSVRVGLRVHAPGEARLFGLRLGGDPAPVPAVAHGEHLLVTNRYPSYAAPYNNMFVHKRVQGYVGADVPTDVVRVVERAPRRVHEFEGIECTTGGRVVLDALLAAGDHRSIAAHFMTPVVWEMLEPHLDHRRLCVWIHGFEVQPWWRRAFSYESEEELAHAKAATAERMAMWREVLADPRPHFVFVSQFLADQAMEDTGVTLAEDRYSVIHNPIDTDLFAQHEKDPEQRFHLLSIRPFASNIYANDLTAAALLELVDEPWFDRLRVRMIGEGRLFEEVTAPLRDLPNVSLEPRFLQQAEIARLHREHGVFLCPSRLDSHGVSRDEAMASGLVPITSDVAAIPEFVDDDCAFLAPPDDHHAIADAIRTLVEDPDLFLRMSAAAAARVRRQADHRRVLAQELAVLRR